MAGKHVYVSYAPADARDGDIVTAALDAWEVTYAQSASHLGAGDHLSDPQQAAIRESEVCLRLCSFATADSALMYAELLYFTNLQAEDQHQRKRQQRTLVNIILDTRYIRETFDKATLFIDTSNKTRALWLDELARAIGVATPARRISRRAALALGAASLVTLVSGGAAGTFFLRNAKALSDARGAAKAIPTFGPGDTVGGQPAWTIAVSQTPGTDPNTYNASIGLAASGNGILYAFAQNTIIALDAQHHTLWSSTKYQNIAVISQGITDVIPQPYTDGNVLAFYDTEDSGTSVYLNVLNARDQTLRTHIPVIFSNPNFIGPAGRVSVVGNTLFCIFPVNGILSASAFDLTTGKNLWSVAIGTGTPHPSLTYFNGRVYVGGSYAFYCLNAADGTQIWRYPLPSVVVSTAAVDAHTVYFGALDGAFIALDAQSGALRWQIACGNPIIAPATIVNGVIYIGDGAGYLWALDARHGTYYWRTFAGAEEKLDAGTQYAVISYQPVVYGNLVAVAAGDTLSAIDLVTGVRRWPFQLQLTMNSTRGTVSGPYLLGGVFAIGDAQNHVIGINP